MKRSIKTVPFVHRCLKSSKFLWDDHRWPIFYWCQFWIECWVGTHVS